MPPLPASLFAGPPFNGSLVGVKVVGMAVTDLDRTVNCCGGTFPQPNIVYTYADVNPMPTDDQIELAANAVDQAGAGANTWFNFLRQLGGTDLGGDLHLGAVLLHERARPRHRRDRELLHLLDRRHRGGDGTLSLGVFEAVRGYEFAGGPPTEYTPVAILSLDGTNVTFEPAPEASQALLLLVGVAALWGGARMRRSSDLR